MIPFEMTDRRRRRGGMRNNPGR